MKNTKSQKIINYCSVAAIMVLFSILYIGIASAQQVSGQSSSVPSTPLSLTGLYVSPTPVMAGDTVNVTFELFNSYSQPLQDVNIQLESQNQIINVSPAYSSIITSIGSGYFGAFGYDEFNYTLHIPSTMQEGDYVLYVVATYRTSETSATGQSVETPMESEIPIYLYVYGKPDIKTTGVPTMQIIPGEPFALDITALNSGTETATNSTLTISNSSDLEITGTKVFNLGSLAVGEPEQVTEPMFASQNLTQGTHYINGTISYTDGLGNVIYQNVSMPVSVLLNKPNIVLSLVGAQPQSLYAGSNQSITVMVQNTGTGTARNITLNFSSGPSVSVESSVNSFYINSLPAGSSTTENLYVGTYGQNIKNTSILAHVDYKNADYLKSYSDVQQLSMHVEASAIYNITGESATLTPGATYVPVTIRVKNTGNEQAKGVLLTLESVYPVTMVSSTYYVNSIAPNQTVNATFYVSVDSNGEPGDYPVTLYEQWKQLNSPQSEEFAGSSQYFVSIGSSSSSSSIIDIAVAIIVIIILVVAIRTVRKRSKSAAQPKEKQKRKA